MRTSTHTHTHTHTYTHTHTHTHTPTNSRNIHTHSRLNLDTCTHQCCSWEKSKRIQKCTKIFKNVSIVFKNVSKEYPLFSLIKYQVFYYLKHFCIFTYSLSIIIRLATVKISTIFKISNIMRNCDTVQWFSTTLKFVFILYRLDC